MHGTDGMTLYEFRLHLLERFDELVQILHIEHDGGLLAAAGLFGNFEEFAVAGFLEVDVERALTCVDGDAVHILSETTACIVTAHGGWTRWLCRTAEPSRTHEFTILRWSTREI